MLSAVMYLLWLVVGFLVMVGLSLLFYEIGWWPLGSATRVISVLILIGLVLVGIPMFIHAGYRSMKGEED